MCQDGLRTGSYANSLCQITAVTTESFTAPGLDVFLITQTEESPCNAGDGIGIWSAERHWEADPTTAGRGHFQLHQVGPN